MISENINNLIEAQHELPVPNFWGISATSCLYVDSLRKSLLHNFKLVAEKTYFLESGGWHFLLAGRAKSDDWSPAYLVLNARRQYLKPELEIF